MSRPGFQEGVKTRRLRCGFLAGIDTAAEPIGNGRTGMTERQVDYGARTSAAYFETPEPIRQKVRRHTRRGVSGAPVSREPIRAL